MIYEEQINQTIDKLVFEQFIQTPAYTAIKANIFQTAGLTIEEIDSFLQTLVSKGVNIEQALICLSELLKTKL